MEDLLKVLNFDGPSRLPTQDVDANYYIHKALDNRDPETPYLEHETISYITNANSNQYLDSRGSYLFFRATVYQTTTRAQIGSTLAEDAYCLNSGLPFSGLRESVNNNVPICEFNDGFNRFTTGRFLCSSKPLHNKAVRAYASYGGSYTDQKYGVFQDLDMSESEEYAGCNIIDRPRRSNGIILYKRDGALPYVMGSGYLYFYIPLNCISALASSNQLLPIGYLSQVSQIGHRIDLTVISNILGVNRKTPSDASLQGVQIRIHEPVLVARYLTIKNPELQEVLLKRFKRLTPEAPMLIPYNSFFGDSSYRFLAGEGELRAKYMVSKRSLKGVMIRFMTENIKNSEQIDKNLADVSLNFKSFQISYGGNSKTVPVQPYNENNYQVSNSVINSYFAHQYNISRAIFDPSNTYSTTGCYNRYFPNEAGGSPGNQCKFIVIDLENLRMMNDNSEQVNRANGENTYVNGNTLEIYIQLHNVLSINVQFETFFCYSSVLMISDNYIENIENKSFV